jgi:hypothetical protein
LGIRVTYMRHACHDLPCQARLNLNFTCLQKPAEIAVSQALSKA